MRFITVFFLFFLMCMLLADPAPAVAFFSDKPSDEQVAEQIQAVLLERQNVLHCAIDGFDASWEERGENLLLGKVTATLRLTEDHYVPGRLRERYGEIKSKYGIDLYSLQRSLSDARELAHQQREPLRSSLKEQSPPDLPGFLTVSDPAGSTLKISFAIQAEKNRDGWNLKTGGVNWHSLPKGYPYSLAGPGLMFDSPEMEKLIKAQVTAIPAYQALVRQAVDEAEAARVAALAKHKAELNVALRQGNSFRGFWTYGKNRGDIAFTLESISPDGFSCTGYFFDPADPSKRKTFTGKINRTLGANYILLLSARRAGEPASALITNTQKLWLGGNPYTVRLWLKNGGWTGEREGGYLLEFGQFLIPD